MTPGQLVAFNLALAVAIASPGPAMLYLVRTTLVRGRAAGLATGAGLATMAALWTLAALAGLDALFRLFPWAYTTFKIAGALYLLHVAWRTWRAASAPVAAPPRPGASSFLDGLLVNLANPKSVLFAAAVLVVIFPGGLRFGDMALVVANHLIIEILAYSALAWALSAELVSSQILRAKPILDRIAAVVLGGFGLKLLGER